VRNKSPQVLLARYLNKFPKKGTKKSKRKHTILEVYSDRYYKSKLQGLVNDELKNDQEFQSLPQKKQQAYQLSAYRRIRADCWKNESDEVKAEIQSIFDEEYGVKAEQDDKDNVDGNDSETKEDEDNDNDLNDDEDDEKILLQHRQE